VPRAVHPVSCHKLVIGLVGGIGSGKSRIAEGFEGLGAHVISGDRLGHEALRQPATIKQIVTRWGREVLDEHGEVNRRELGKKVFADPKELRELEKLVFPHIQRRIREEIESAQEMPGIRYVVLDAAVMLEAGWDAECDYVVFVHAPKDVRMERLARERGWTIEDLEARERAQLPLAEKLSRVDFVLENSGSTQEMTEQIEELLRQMSLVSGHARMGMTRQE